MMIEIEKKEPVGYCCESPGVIDIKDLYDLAKREMHCIEDTGMVDQEKLQ